VGEETVIYVGNVYKYYVAYRLTADERKRRGLAASLLDSVRGGDDLLTAYFSKAVPPVSGGVREPEPGGSIENHKRLAQ